MGPQAIAGWALMGRNPYGVDPYWPPWALMGRACMGWALTGLALMGQALMGLALMGQALTGRAVTAPPGPSRAEPLWAGP